MIRDPISSLLSLCAVCAIIGIATCEVAYSQPYTVTIQDSIILSTIVNSGQDTANPSKYSAAYVFGFLYDSCQSEYVVSEIKQNSNRLKLENWYPWKVIDTLSADSLSLLSVSENTLLSSGDTISVFRDFRWGNYLLDSNHMLMGNYRSDDTLTALILLLDSTNNSRLAVLDSFVVLRRIPSGPPSFLTHFPIFKKAEYVVPSGQNGATAYIKIEIDLKGEGDYFPSRKDEIVYAQSSKLTSSNYANFRTLYNYGFNKSRTIFEQVGSKVTDVEWINGAIVSEPVFELIHNDDASSHTYSIYVYDVRGEVVGSTPHVILSPGESRELRLPTLYTGTYVRVLIKDNSPVKSSKFQLSL